MQRSADIVVVGAGINGAAVAFWLAEKGIGTVLVLDANYPCHGASGRGDGIIRTHYADPHEIELARRSLAIFRDWSDVVGGICEFLPNGFVWLAAEDEVEAVVRNVEQQRAQGVVVELLSPSDLLELQPHLQVEDIGVAAYEPQSGGGNAAAATRSLLNAALRRGAVLETHTPVRKLAARGEEIVGVQTDDGFIASSTVVLAAGAWSRNLAAGVGVDLPIEAVRCTTGRIFLPSELKRPMNFIDGARNLFFKVTADGLAHIAVRDSEHFKTADPDRYVRSAELPALLEGRNRLSHRIPAVASAALDEAWAGVDAVTPDGKAILGPVAGMRGLQLCLGSSFKGFKLAPAVGAIVAESVAAAETSMDVSHYALERFESERERWVDSGYARTALA